MTRLYRSNYDRKITGLCGGIAQRYSVDATIVRLIAVASIFVTSGASIPIYFIAAMVVPKEPWTGGGQHDPGFGPGYHGGYGSQGSQHGSWKDWKKAEKQQRHAGRQDSWGASQHTYGAPQEPQADPIDEMMEDIERKAMWKEIEQLRAKVAEYEKKTSDAKPVAKPEDPDKPVS